MVWFGLSGPVTHPTIDVPTGLAGTGTGAAAGWAAVGACWVWAAVPFGFGLGTTSACCCTGAERGGGVSALMSAGNRPSLGSGDASFEPAGLCPIGRLNGEIRDGLGISKAWVARGCAVAAAPSQGSAMAGGATPIATLSPRTVIDATDSEAIRGRGDMSHLSGAGRRIDVCC